MMFSRSGNDVRLYHQLEPLAVAINQDSHGLAASGSCTKDTRIHIGRWSSVELDELITFLETNPLRARAGDDVPHGECAAGNASEIEAHCPLTRARRRGWRALAHGWQRGG